MKPLIGITMGDPAGVGPEISVKAAASVKLSEIARMVIFGSPSVIRYYTNLLKITTKVKEITSPSEYKSGYINVLAVNDVRMEEFIIGELSPICGKAAYKYVKAAVKEAKNHEINAVVTAPLNKDALHKAGVNLAGHTEILARLTDTADYAMMLITDLLKVVHVTTHVSLKKACDLVTKERVIKVIKLAQNGAKSLGIATPKIAVAGLNPHAGESGLFGFEEQEHIIPAVKTALESGIDVYGPLPPDTVFYKAIKGEFDIVVAMYHDQGHIPIKVLGFDEGVNITLGLPIIRTSVDHGTAFDIAGKGVASEKSMFEAIRYAVMITRQSISA